MLGQGCGKTVLARGPCAEVTRCTCGHIHLALGPVTIRVEEEVLRAIGMTLLEAIQQLGPRAHASEDEVAPAVPGGLVTTGGWKQ
ncbi:hypothetical protein HPC49_29350 [Pyxidicoccus fallax]|uniref:Uncharacterized protein n=1 Tax=Pyxidicoccus fallax TaxID=394095 RepID=A0A848LIA7_9BACT|nr:hypothetical protein [Pyxidicoccus fallax]NMO17452.1 hypothetical protein [Pyxidicoccus fallax]NPC82313.1 hypothetical protein [Pyxidicoccus fallax]